MDDKLGLVLIGTAIVGLGIGIAIMLALFMTKKVTYVEVVRDADGRIRQIIEVNDIQPMTGRWMLNVTEPIEYIEKTEP